MNQLFFLCSLLAIVGTSTAAEAGVNGSAPGLSPEQCPFIPKGSTSPSTFACALAGTPSCCTQKNGIAVLSTQWIPGKGPEEVTLHGLWPNTCSNGRTPNGGCTPVRYSSISSTVDRDVLSDMNTYWPSKFEDNESFWMHEYEKHGTCVTTMNAECYDRATYKPGMEVSEYFRTALNLRRQFELYRALKKNGFVATLDQRKWKTADEISDIIKKEYGVGVQIKCQGGLAYEFVMYFAAQGRDSFVPIDLPSNLKHSCGKAGAKIGLPPKDISESQMEMLKRTLGYDLETIMRKDEI